MAKISLRIPDTLLNDVDELLKISKYQNRSELIRDLLRKWVNGKKHNVEVK
ncbi:MAG: transcriptional regulator [Thermoprotei archaeon]|nr:MAG: transcriptional regulator [Thermoprotei archaeon]